MTLPFSHKPLKLATVSQDCESLKYISVDSDSAYRRVIEEMGFVFLWVETFVRDHAVFLNAEVLCKCNRIESFRVRIDLDLFTYAACPLIKDAYKMVFDTGSFTPQHLKDDNFDEEVVSKAEYVYNKFMHDLRYNLIGD